jgi:predicted esterase
MQEHHLPTVKTARYYLLSEPSYKIKRVCILFHGYAQLAKEMLENFKDLQDEETLFIAPEGFNRFYKRGFYGDVGASWMTKEDREIEIKDYLIFINNLYQSISTQLNAPKTSVNLFGFSQGAATAFRVFADNKFKVDNLILWAGSPPRDSDFKKARILSVSTNIKIYVGNEDKLVNHEKMNETLNLLKESKLKYELINYNGGHEIPEGLLKEAILICKR